MGAKFCFFTDPAKLAKQQPAQAFGPAAASAGKDRFRVADVHQVSTAATTAANAYAICRGQVCLQAVGTTLNLILRPLAQPPFDFPYVEYFIYRGLRADSLLASDGQLDLGKEGTGATLNNLIAYIREKVLKLAAPQATKVTAAHLGLDRKHDPATTATHGGAWGDGQPLDHLFRYPGAAELPVVEAGWTLGEFGATFGFEVVVQQYGAQPKISWARNADPWIEAPPIQTGATVAVAYPSRLQREAIGGFVDPCAFWGMFWSDGLTITGEGSKRDKQLCDLLFGAAPGIFANRARAYLDIRNETGLSYDFYGAWQDKIDIGPSKSALAETSYGTAGWPIHFADPAPPEFFFRLRRNGAPAPLLFLRQAGRSQPAKPFEDMIDTADALWTRMIRFKRPEKSGTRPPWWFVAHYLRGEVGTAAAPTAGAFDTSLLQFGPIGDRVIAAYRQMWPAGTGVPTGTVGAGGYERQFVTDKVLRHDGAVKADPLDPNRSLAYDRMGETSYVFQKGTGSNTGRDSVIIIQRRAFERKRTPSGTWNQANSVKITSSSGVLLYGALTGEFLSSPVSVTLSPAITVSSFLELRSDTPKKAELFDYTILLLSKAVFEAALTAAGGIGPPPGPGEQHPIFLSLSAQTTSVPARASGYSLGWMSWSGQSVTGAPGIAQIYSADGIFFSSPDFDRAGLDGAGMGVRVEIPRTDAQNRVFLTWAPVEATARLVGGTTEDPDFAITLRDAGPVGHVLLGHQQSDAGASSLQLNLPQSGTPVSFWVAGQFGAPSRSYGDAAIEAVDSNGWIAGRRPLMVRVRKNVLDLDKNERERFLAAYGTLNLAGAGRFADFRAVHTIISDAEMHGGMGFLPWHRAFILDLERELQAIDASVALPYWQFDEAAALLFTKEFLGEANVNGAVEFNPGHPLEHWTTDSTNVIFRKPSFAVTAAPSVLKEDKTLALGGATADYAGFAAMEGNPHAATHLSFDVPGFLREKNNAVRDPLFFLLHANVDRLWAKWQWTYKRMDPASSFAFAEIASNRAGHKLADTMWPWNGLTGDPDPTVSPTDRPPTAPGGAFPDSAVTPDAPASKPTVREMIDFQGIVTAAADLGFAYDDVPFRGAV